MATFASILAQLNENGPPLLAATDLKDEEMASVETIRRGMRLRSQNDADETFWADLRALANSNRKGLAALLGVRPEVVARWPGIISHYMTKAKQIDAMANSQKKPTMIPTGHPAPNVGMAGQMGDSNTVTHGPF